MAKLKPHWASKILDKSMNHYHNKLMLPKFLRLPTPVELGKAKYNALPIKRFSKEGDYTWSDYKSEMKKDYPIKYFIFETADRWFRNNLIAPISKFKYYVRSHTIRKYHLLDLRSKSFGYDYGWRDSDTQMLLALMKIMENFIVEQDTENRIIWLKEELKNNTDDNGYRWEEDIKRCEELLAIQKWWRVDRQKKHDEFHDKDTYGDYKDYFEREEQLNKEDDEMMKKLIDMRGGMWT
jgi:hypothetical protein